MAKKYTEELRLFLGMALLLFLAAGLAVSLGTASFFKRLRPFLADIIALLLFFAVAYFWPLL